MAGSGDLKALLFEEFSGGWNIRDSQFDLPLNETPNTLNCTIDGAGSIGGRLGYTRSNATAAAGVPAGSVAVAGYYSDLLGQNFWQIWDELFSQQTGTSNLVSSWVFSNDDVPCAMVDFNGYLYAVDKLEGVVRTSNGSVWTSVTNSPLGDTIAAWQNKLWVGSSASERVSYSCAGAGADWVVGDGTGTDSGTVDIRAKDSAYVTALHASETEGLLCYKQESCYRIFDSATGAYQTLDTRYGATNHYAVVTADNLVFSICQHGVFVTDGNSELKEVTGKIQPLFDPSIINFATANKWCAGWKPPNIYFSLTYGPSQETNNLVLEISPTDGWIMPHDCAASVYVTYGENDVKLLGGAPTTDGRIYVFYDDVGTDDGTDIHSYFQTAWVRPNLYGNCRYRELIARGSSAVDAVGLDCYVRLNGNTQTGDLRVLKGLSRSGTEYEWNDGSTWDGGVAVWGPTAQYENTGYAYSLGIGRDISFEIDVTSDETHQTVPLFGTAATGFVKGAWHLSGLRLAYVELGRAK